MYEGQTWTYKQAYDIVLKYGAWFKSRHGVQPKEIVAMDYMNSHHFAFLWLGLWSIGARPAFINYNLTGQALVHCIRTSTARLLIVDPEVKPAVTDDVIREITTAGFREGAQSSVEVVFFTPNVETEVLSVESQRAPDSTRAGAMSQDMAILIYTSGTTGLPKPAIVSWNKPTHASRFAHDWMGWRDDDVMYTVSSHCFGHPFASRSK